MKKWIKDNLGLVIKVGIIFILLIWFIVLNILKNNVSKYHNNRGSGCYPYCFNS